MTTGDHSRTPPDAENYLDLSDVEDEAPGPHFDVVLRGYDRKQVDDHVAGLRRMVEQLRAQLAVRQRRRPEPAGVAPETIPEARIPAERSSSDDGSAPESPDVVSAFNDRLQGILQAAEQEAQMVRSRAAESLLAEHAESHAALADLRAQRDAVFDDLVRLRGWLDELVTTAGRPGSPPPAMGGAGRPGPWSRPQGHGGPGGGYGPQAPRRPQPQPYPRRAAAPTPAAPATWGHAGTTDVDTVQGVEAVPEHLSALDDENTAETGAVTSVPEGTELAGERGAHDGDGPHGSDATISVDRSTS